MQHVLLVEDHPDVRSALRTAFEADGIYRITTAADADEAGDVALRLRPDAALLDAVIPGRCSGLALARELISLDIPVLLISGEPQHLRRLADAGCRVLAKPFRLDTLFAETRLLLADAERRKADLAASLDRLLGTRAQVSRLIDEARSIVAETRRQREDRGWYERLRSCTALFDELIGEAVAATGADMGALQVIDRRSNVLRLVASRGFEERVLAFFAKVGPKEDSASGAAFRQAGRVIVPDIRYSVIFAGRRSGEILHEAGVHSVQSTPILGKTGCVIGMISTHRRSVWQPSADELRRLDAVVVRAARVIEAALG